MAEGQLNPATLLQALQALYHHPEAEIRAAANKWLEVFQQTPEAWSISDGVLHDASGSFEAQVFCAQTLRAKIQRDFEELPPGAAVALRDSLMRLLLRFQQGPQAVRTQLCLAIAALAGHMPASEWANGVIGEGVVRWLASQLGSQPDAVPGLLELLAVLPQEAGSYKLAVKPERRRQHTVELAASTRDAFGVLVACLQAAGSDAQTREQVLLAFAAWLRLAPGSIPASELAASPLVSTALNSLKSSETFEAAVDAVCELIRYTMSSGGPESLVTNMPLVQEIVPRVMALRPHFVAAVQAATQELGGREGAEVDIDEEESSRAMARLFAEMGEAYVDLVASGSPDAVAVAQALLEVASHPDHGIAATTFRFWHKLSRALTSKARVNVEGEGAVTAEKERRLGLFRPLFQMLVGLVSGRVRCPEGFEEWRRDERADFKHTRNAVADVLLDVADVLGGETLLAALARPLFSPPPAGSPWDWRVAEGALFCIRGIGRSVPKSEAQVLPQVLMLLPSLPNHPQLLYTAALTTAAYADWLAATPAVLSLLPNLLTLLTTGLAGPEDTAAAASLALKHVCDTCATHIAGSGMVDVLWKVYRCALGAEGNPQLHLDDEDVLQILEGLCKIVSTLPQERLPEALTALCLPIIQPLSELLVAAREENNPNAPTTRQFLVHVDRLADVFRGVAVPAAVAEALRQLWPLLQALFQAKGGDARLMERLCRACKHAIRGGGREVAGMIPDLLREVEQRFREHHQPCMLYVASEAIKTFGGDPACVELLGAVLNVMLTEATGMLRQLQDFTSNPDVADDCFLLASRALRYCPQLVALTPLLGQLLDCALVGITVQHREASKSILAFLEAVVGLGLSEESIRFRSAVEAAVLQRGPDLTRILLAALGGALPEARLDDVADFYVVFSRMCGQRLVQWTQEALSLIPTVALTDNEKSAFVQSFAVAGGGQERPAPLVNALYEFSDVCRRNRRSLDAVQAALQPYRTR